MIEVETDPIFILFWKYISADHYHQNHQKLTEKVVFSWTTLLQYTENNFDHKKSILMKEYKFNTIFIIFTMALIVCDFIYFASKLFFIH